MKRDKESIKLIWQKELHKAQNRYNWSNEEMATLYRIVGLLIKEIKNKAKKRVLMEIEKI